MTEPNSELSWDEALDAALSEVDTFAEFINILANQ
jgi:hypothetical protein